MPTEAHRRTRPERAAAGRPAAELGGRLHQALERLWRLRRPADQDAICCHGITHNQWNLLQLIGEDPAEGHRMGALAARLGLTPSGVTRCAEPLVERGLIERCMRPGDRRVCCLRATEAGAALRRAIARECARREGRLLESLPPEERAPAVRLMERLAEAAAAGPPPHGGAGRPRGSAP